MSQEVAVIASRPPMATEAPLDLAAGPSTSSNATSTTTSTTTTTTTTTTTSSSVATVDREYVIQPNTIIELVDLYVPPVRTDFRIPIFQPPAEVPALNRGDGGVEGVRGRRRGRPPLGSRPSNISLRKPYRRRIRQESPPPLPPVPNYLSHVINPLENEVYPKVIVQPASQPFEVPKNLSKNLPPIPMPMPLPPPVALSPPSAPSIKPPPRDTTDKEAAQLRENLKLFGPNVTITQVTCHGQTRFLAIQTKPNGEQRKILFSAGQLQAFVASCRATLMLSRGGGVSRPKLLTPSVTRLRPGPAPRRLIEPPVPPPPPPAAQPPRVIVEPPPNFRLPTMAALRAAAMNARQAGAGAGPAAGPLSLGERVGFEVGVEVGEGGRPVVRPTQLVVKVPAAPKEPVAAAPPPAPAKAPEPPIPVQTLPPAKATPPPPPLPLPRPTPLELSRSRVPSILTRKSQLRLLNQRAKRAAEREVEEAKKMREDHKENYLLNILKHKIQKPLGS